MNLKWLDSLSDTGLLQWIEDLPSVCFGPYDWLPDIAGVYIAFVGNEPVYVGESQGIRSRWKNHGRRYELTHVDGVVKIAWLPVEDAVTRKAVERYLIIRLEPRLNGTPIPR